VLLALADQPRHGYAIVGEVAALSAGRVRLGAGTLYGLLDRLVGAGQVEHARDEVVDGRLRRYYRLTPDGSASAAAETARLGELAGRAHRLLGGPALGTA
jgi:DNA-binding PadR family transcriptional regulator